MGQAASSSEVRIRALEQKVKTLEFQLDAALKWSAQIQSRWHDTVDFDPALPDAFQRLDTDTGALFATLGVVEPYLDGYKVNLFIGNPSTARISTYTLSVKWAPRRKPEDSYDKWLKGRKEKVFEESEELRPGKWTALAIILPATSSSEFGYLQIQIDPKSVKMSDP